MEKKEIIDLDYNKIVLQVNIENGDYKAVYDNLSRIELYGLITF